MRTFFGGALLIIAHNIADLQFLKRSAGGDSYTIGFVPTMGALHNGHLSLIDEAKKGSDRTIVSIFVNPTQFNDPTDYLKYPRDLERDISMLESSGCDAVYLPTESEIYPDDTFKTTAFDPGHLNSVMEGKYRSGHFAGVAAVVKRLLELVKPTIAYFGQKDYQQYLIIKKLIQDFRLDVQVNLCPVIRQSNGLAMSSRNQRLSPAAREEAGIIYQALEEAADKLERQIITLSEVFQVGKSRIESKRNFKVEYFDICSAIDLQPLSEKNIGQPKIICTAVSIEGIRLIDNLLLT